MQFIKKCVNFVTGKDKVSNGRREERRSDRGNEKHQRHCEPLLRKPGYAGAGVQGLDWFVDKLKCDEDGDVADEFFCETPACEGLQINQKTARAPAHRIGVKDGIIELKQRS